MELWEFLLNLYYWDKETHHPGRIIRGFLVTVANTISRSKLAFERNAGAIAENGYNEYETFWFGVTGCWMMRHMFGLDSAAF